MANALYPIGKKGLLDADIDLSADTIKVALVDTGTYTYSAAHDMYDDVSAGVVGTPVTLGTKTTTAIDLAGAAPLAHRLQPRGAPDRADGACRPGVADGQQRQP